MAAGTFRSSYYYGVGDAKKDFDLHLVRVVPPANKPPYPSNYGVMPGHSSEAKLHRGRQTFAMSGGSSAPPPNSPTGEEDAKSKSSLKKMVRGLFKSNASGKTKKGDPQGPGSSPAHPGAQQRSRSSTWSSNTGRNVATRPTTSVEEGDRGEAPFKAQRVSEDIDGAAATPIESLLIRLTLLPRKSTHETEVRQVTLKRKPDGFGVHLSGGFPPIGVTYVEPGGEAELAGVEVGDEVLEVNGQDCRKGIEVTKLMELKMLIQQVAVSKTSSTGWQSSGLEEEKAAAISIDDAAWERIKFRQLQDDDLNSEASSSMEVTHIDEVSDSGSVEEYNHEMRVAPVPSPLTKEVHISEKDWSRVRTQRELLFGQNSPSTIIREKGREVTTETTTANSTTTPGLASSLQKTRELKPKRKKKKSPSAEELTTMASSSRELVPSVSSQDGQSGKPVQGSKVKKRKKTTSAGSMEEGPQKKSPRSRGLSSDESLSPTGKAGDKAKKKRKRSKSEETDGTGKGTIEQAAASLRSEIDPTLKVKKSGVVIGPSSSRGNSRRPSLSLFDQAPKPEEEGRKEREQLPSPENEVDAADVDLSAVPHTAPTLGLKVGHAKRDVSLKRKRHRASAKDPLLLGVQPDKVPQRRSTMPSKLKHSTKHSPATGKAAEKTTTKKEGWPPKTEDQKEKEKEEEKKEGEGEEEGEMPQNFILHTHRNSLQRQESNGLPALSADRVTQATSLKRQESAESENMGEPVSTDENKENKQKDDSPLTKLQRYPPSESLNVLAEVGRDEGERTSVSRRLFPQNTEQSGAGSGKEASTVGSEAPTPLAKASPPTAAKPRRIKSVEMPVKTLVMASESKEGASSAPEREASGEAADAAGQQTRPRVQLRKVGHDRKMVERDSSADSIQPAWVTIAQNKHRRTSVLYGNQENAEPAPSAVAADDKKEAVSQVETGVDHTPSLTSVVPATKAVEVKADDPSAQASHVPSTPPTSKHVEVKGGVPSLRMTEAGHTPSTPPTFKADGKAHPTLTPTQEGRRTAQAGHTHSTPPSVNQEKKAERATPPVESRISHHAPTTTPPSHQPPPKKTDSSLPRAGHVRDRLAMFQRSN